MSHFYNSYNSYFRNCDDSHIHLEFFGYTSPLSKERADG